MFGPLQDEREPLRCIYLSLIPSSVSASLSSYSHYVFATLDHDDTGVITFEVRIKDHNVIKVILGYSDTFETRVTTNTRFYLQLLDK